MLAGLLALAVFDSINPSAIAGWALLSIVGLAMVIYAIRAPKMSAAPAREPRASTYAGLLLLGVVVTAMELPTAIPYFGAIALLTAAELPATRWLALLIAYNVIFVLPPLLLLAGHIIFGRRLDARYDELRQRLQAGARETMLWILGLVGGGLFFWGLAEFLATSSS